MALSYGVGETVWMHPPVHRILGWSTKPSNFNLQRNVWRLNQVKQIIDNEIFIKGEPAISDLETLNRFPTLLFANLINVNGSKIGWIADFIFEFETGNIKYYLISRSNPRIPGSSRWKLDITSITDQQPGLVFCSQESLDEFTLLKSSWKNEMFKKSKVILNRFDNIKNFATNRLEDWLEEDEFSDIEYKYMNQEKNFTPNKSLNTPQNRDKNFNSDNIDSKSSKKNKEDDPWI
tara:strand:- start:321 stop:1022 length:702 start_codon:yes stop_codon:yes gene_type:complete